MFDFKKLSAEAFGTFWLVFGGCGSAVLAAAYPELGIGFAGVSIAFGLTVLTMAFAIGPVSGCHLNPAVTLGLAAGGRFNWKDAPGYIVAQVLGAILAAYLLSIVAAGAPGFGGALASNGFGDHSPGGYSSTAGAIIEVIMTLGFLVVIMGATEKRAMLGMAPVAIGLCLTLIHLISIPVTNTSVNPARSTGPALLEGGIALQQLWFFWVWPVIGGLVGGTLYKQLWEENSSVESVSPIGSEEPAC